MKNYLKHLSKNPLKIIWLILIWSFSVAFGIILLVGKEVIVEDNVRVLVFSSVKVNANHSENPNSCQTQTNIKLITAVAIDTNTCYNFGLTHKKLCIKL